MENNIKLESNNSIDKENSNNNNNNIITQKAPNDKQIITKDQNDQNQSQNSKNEKSGNTEERVIPKRGFKRSNSINLYKKQQKEKHKKESSINNNEEVKEENVNNAPLEDNGAEKLNKLNKKKVMFLPDFLTIIDVESYKKFNAENTCKDPFDNLELLNGTIISKNKDGDDDEIDGKTTLQCSCFIF